MPKSKETISESESESGSGSEEEVKGKSKSRPKKEQKKKHSSSEAESSESESDSKSKKRSKKSNDKGNANKKQKKNSDGDDTWDLGGNKQVNVRNFKGKWFVDIREMYEKDGKMLPGKKGICMNFENWRELYKVVDEVNECVKSKC